MPIGNDALDYMSAETPGDAGDVLVRDPDSAWGIRWASASELSGVVSGVKAPIPIVGDDFAAGTYSAALSAGSTLTKTTGPNGRPALRLQIPAGQDAEIIFNAAVGAQWHGDAALLMHGTYSAGGVNYVTLYASQDNATYANGINQFIQYGTPAPTNSGLEQGGALTYLFRKARHANFGAPSWPMNVGQMKVRVTARSDQAADAYIYGLGIGSSPKGRICVTWDDGYESMFSAGYDSFASRGIKQTLAVIASAQGTGSGFSYLRQLSAFVSAGGALVAHGPLPNSGAGNLFSAYGGVSSPSAVSDALADMVASRKWLRDRGLLVPGADRCYVWPQGVFQRSANDTALLDAAMSQGFELSRSVHQLQNDAVWGAGSNFDALSRYQRMALPIIGHTWAGSTAAEATNISQITAAVSAVAQSGGDACLMLHRVQPTGTPDGSMSSIGIRKADLETIAAAIKAQMDAGKLDSVTMPELAGSTWWAQ